MYDLFVTYLPFSLALLDLLILEQFNSNVNFFQIHLLAYSKSSLTNNTLVLFLFLQFNSLQPLYHWSLLSSIHPTHDLLSNLFLHLDRTSWRSASQLLALFLFPPIREDFPLRPPYPVNQPEGNTRIDIAGLRADW